MIAQLNHIAQIWWEWMFPMFWQVSLLITLVTLLDMAIRRWAWPQVRYALWGLIFIKLIIPPSWQMPTSVVSWIQPKVENRISIQVEPGNLITATSHQASFSSVSQQRQSAPQAVTSETLKVNWKGFAFLFWLAGMIAFSLMLFLKMSRLPKRHKAQTQGIAPEWFDDIFTRTSQRLKLRQMPTVVFSKDAMTPAVYGLFRPVLLLPVRGLDQFSKEQAEHVLMHELCHLKRGDLLLHWFCIILQIFYWFNPLLIWTRRQMRYVCEICCDLSVANILREETADYRNTLIESTYRLFTETVEPGLGLLGLFEEPFRIASRLKWLEKKTWKNRKRKIAAAIVTSLIMVICVMPMAGRSQSTEQKNSPIRPAIETKERLSDEDAKLIEAAEKGDLSAVRTVLNNGADVNAIDNRRGITALMAASQSGHADVVMLLLDNGADVNAKNINGYTALMAVSRLGHMDVVKLLLDNSADVNAKKNTDSETALYLASKYDHADIVRLLMENGAIVNETNGAYALMKAKEKDYTDIVKMLEKAGAKENINAYNTVARRNLMDADIVQEAYWIDNETYTDSIKKLEDNYGLHIDEGVTLQIISADKDHYKMIVFHSKGDKRYQISGPGGHIEEYSESGGISSNIPATVIKFSGAASRGQTFEKEIGQGVVFRLTPDECGWNIEIANKTQPDHDLAGTVTPPLRGINARYIEGWHFRNSDNSGPNDGSVNAPQKEREFYFVLNEADYQAASIYDELIIHSYEFINMPEQDKKQIEEQYKKINIREGKLTITHLELGNLIAGERAWIDYMEFEVTLDLPVSLGNK